MESQMDTQREAVGQARQHGTCAQRQAWALGDAARRRPRREIPTPWRWGRRARAAFQGTLAVCALLAAPGPVPTPVFAQAVTYTTYTLPYTYGIYPRGVAV